MRPLLGTFVEIGVDANDACDGGIEAAFQSVARVQNLMSFQDRDSELSRLNRSVVGEWVSLSQPILRVLRLAKNFGAKSGELFNCTVGGALVERGLLPDHTGMKPLMIGKSGDIELAMGRARLLRPVRITLDGIAKGFAVDCAVATLRRHGIRSGWVNGGGDMRVFGTMQSPVYRRELNGRSAMLGRLHGAALATSATRADPSLGYHGELIPAATALASPDLVTVVASRAWLADALTKVAALLPQRERRDRLRRLGGDIVDGRHRSGIARAAA